MLADNKNSFVDRIEENILGVGQGVLQDGVAGEGCLVAVKVGDIFGPESSVVQVDKLGRSKIITGIGRE